VLILAGGAWWLLAGGPARPTVRAALPPDAGARGAPPVEGRVRIRRDGAPAPVTRRAEAGPSPPRLVPPRERRVVAHHRPGIAARTPRPSPAPGASAPRRASPRSPADAGSSPGAAAGPGAAGQLAGLTARLRELEQRRQERGIHLEDTLTYRMKLLEARRALGAGKLGGASRALGQAEESLRRVAIDGNFISRKLQRISRLKAGLKLDGRTETQVTEIFAKVHDRYFSGDFSAANTHLNKIWRLLGGAR